MDPSDESIDLDLPKPKPTKVRKSIVQRVFNGGPSLVSSTPLPSKPPLDLNLKTPFAKYRKEDGDGDTETNSSTSKKSNQSNKRDLLSDKNLQRIIRSFRSRGDSIEKSNINDLSAIVEKATSMSKEENVSKNMFRNFCKDKNEESLLRGNVSNKEGNKSGINEDLKTVSNEHKCKSEVKKALSREINRVNRSNSYEYFSNIKKPKSHLKNYNLKNKGLKKTKSKQKRLKEKLKRHRKVEYSSSSSQSVYESSSDSSEKEINIPKKQKKFTQLNLKNKKNNKLKSNKLKTNKSINSSSEESQILISSDDELDNFAIRKIINSSKAKSTISTKINKSIQCRTDLSLKKPIYESSLNLPKGKKSVKEYFGPVRKKQDGFNGQNVGIQTVETYHPVVCDDDRINVKRQNGKLHLFDESYDDSGGGIEKLTEGCDEVHQILEEWSDVDVESVEKGKGTETKTETGKSRHFTNNGQRNDLALSSLESIEKDERQKSPARRSTAAKTLFATKSSPEKVPKEKSIASKKITIVNDIILSSNIQTVREINNDDSEREDNLQPLISSPNNNINNINNSNKSHSKKKISIQPEEMMSGIVEMRSTLSKSDTSLEKSPNKKEIINSNNKGKNKNENVENKNKKVTNRKNEKNNNENKEDKKEVSTRILRSKRLQSLNNTEKGSNDEEQGTILNIKNNTENEKLINKTPKSQIINNENEDKMNSLRIIKSSNKLKNDFQKNEEENKNQKGKEILSPLKEQNTRSKINCKSNVENENLKKDLTNGKVNKSQVNKSNISNNNNKNDGEIEEIDQFSSTLTNNNKIEIRKSKEYFMPLDMSMSTIERESHPVVENNNEIVKEVDPKLQLKSFVAISENERKVISTQLEDLEVKEKTKSDFEFVQPKLPVKKQVRKRKNVPKRNENINLEESGETSTDGLRRSTRKRTPITYEKVYIMIDTRAIKQLEDRTVNLVACKDMKEAENISLRLSRRVNSSKSSSKESTVNESEAGTSQHAINRPKATPKSKANPSTGKSKGRRGRKEQSSELPLQEIQEEVTVNVEKIPEEVVSSVKGKKGGRGKGKKKIEVPSTPLTENSTNLPLEIIPEENFNVNDLNDGNEGKENRDGGEKHEQHEKRRLSSDKLVRSDCIEIVDADKVEKLECFKRSQLYIESQESGVYRSVGLTYKCSNAGRMRIYGSKKSKQTLENSFMHLTVLEGQCQITIGEAYQTLEKNNDCIIPKGATYSISNKTPGEVLELFYCEISS